MIGKTLGHYQITGQLGKGGMGEVYQAKDQKLGRDIAIKLLPEEFSKNSDRVARFQREAKLLASLNHPNIAAIHGLEESAGKQFLVLELVEGETLAERVKAGPIPVEESLKLALQIAEALEAAHEKGVIHRDLKPANIKVTPEGKVKVLDFGLAKAYAGDREDVNLSNSPTLSDAATQQGVILGTAAYMSPEQARGKPVDKRADIWAFGCVLFEMLTGRAAFSGRDVTDILAAVIRSEPDWNGLPANLHGRLREVLERCLKKELKDRYHDISDVRVDIQRVLTDPSGLLVQPVTALEPRPRTRVILPWIAAALVLGAIIAGVAVWKFRTPEPKRVMRFDYELPEDQQFTKDVFLAVSSDGSRFAYSTTKGLYLRSVDAVDARLISGTDPNSRHPSFSPDGQWIAYWSSNDRKLKKIAISGGAPVVLCDTGLYLLGLSWSPDNTIVYSDILGGGVKRVSADGGTPESLVKADLASAGERGMPVYPRMLPDGKTLLFTRQFSPRSNADSQIVVQPLESGKQKVLSQGFDGTYLPTGHLLYGLESNDATNLVTLPFDPGALEVKGGPVPLFEGITSAALSNSGTLIYVTQPKMAMSGSETAAGGTTVSGRTLVWVDRKGREEPIPAPPKDYGYPKISPDGTRIALRAMAKENSDIWIWDLARNTLTRLTFDPGSDIQPIWTPDAKRIVFMANGALNWKAADGTGEEEKLASMTSRTLVPYSWSRDGKALIVTESNATDDFDISMLSMEGDRAIKPLLKTKPNESHPQVSPDGRWLAYCSEESGQVEVYMRPFPDVNGGKWQVSTNGGNSPRWSPDGKELFYLTGQTETEAAMVVPVETEPAFKPGTPKVLFRGKYVGAFPTNGIPWDISPDGKRFLMMKEPHAASSAGESKPAGPRKIHIIVNWMEELKQRIPVK